MRTPRLLAMDDPTLLKLAQQIAAELPAVMRQLFTFSGDPSDELPLGQLRVCVVLLDGPRPMSALSRELGVSVSAMTQLADRLERARLVKRVADGTDRRVRCLQLTPRGERIMQSRREARVRRVSAALVHLSSEGRDAAALGVELLRKASLAAKEPRDGNGEEGRDIGPASPVPLPHRAESLESSELGRKA